MENTNSKTPFFKNIFNSLSVFASTLTKNDESNEIDDIDNLSSFTSDERATIDEIRKVEAQLKRRATNLNPKKDFQNQIKSKNVSIERRTQIQKIECINRVEKEDRIRS